MTYVYIVAALIAGYYAGYIIGIDKPERDARRKAKAYYNKLPKASRK